MEPTRWIAHLDVDAAFCQASFRAWPRRLAGVEYLLVGGHPERRGVVASATHACRRDFGIHAGMPMKTALRLCPQAVAVPVPWPVVRAMSRDLFTLLRGRCERVERASIDEGYLRVPAGVGDVGAWARALREEILREQGTAVSLGVSRLRFTAKMATSHAKPNRGGAGVHVVPAGTEADFVAAHPPGDIPFVGPATVAELERRGVSTVAAIRRIDLATLRLWLGPARAQFIHDRARAIDPEGVREAEGPRKSISSEQTFERDVRDLDVLARELAPLVEDVGATLRREGLFARTVGVKVRSAEFRDAQRHRTLPQFVTSDAAILRVATELLRELRAGARNWVRLLGVTLSGLEGPGAVEQLTLDPLVPPVESEGERAGNR